MKHICIYSINNIIYRLHNNLIALLFNCISAYRISISNNHRTAICAQLCISVLRHCCTNILTTFYICVWREIIIIEPIIVPTISLKLQTLYICPLLYFIIVINCVYCSVSGIVINKYSILLITNSYCVNVFYLYVLCAYC